MSLNLALKVTDLDNVATIFANGITDGTEVEIRDKKGHRRCTLRPQNRRKRHQKRRAHHQIR